MKHRQQSAFTHQKSARFSGGFTIVELLIVIVVIGILAAIVIVAYNGVQERARASSVSSALSQTAKKIAVWQVDNASTSPTCTQFATELGSNDYDCSFTIGSIDYQYTAGTSGAYCTTATTGTTSYYLNTTTATKPTAGGCAGHGVGGIDPITNLSTNPSIETNATGYSPSAYASIARLTGSPPDGAAYLRLNRSAAGDSYASFTTPTVPSANTAYTLSYWMWADTSVTITDNLIFRVYNNSVCCTNLSSNVGQAVTTTPTRVVMSGTTPATPTSGLQIILRATPTVGQNVYYDGFMVTQGALSYTYAGGSSPGWVWNGTTNNSTSTGPPL